MGMKLDMSHWGRYIRWGVQDWNAEKRGPRGTR